MTERHPGGLHTTKQLLTLAQLPPCRILDMGAGEGTTLEYLQQLGYDAWGIDLNPSSFLSNMYSGNFLHAPFEDQSFDAVISECSFFVSNHIAGALEESHRLLSKGGKLLLADVCFSTPKAHLEMVERAGFSISAFEDITPLWKEYYLSCIWEGTENELCSCPTEGACSYYLTICERM